MDGKIVVRGLCLALALQGTAARAVVEAELPKLADSRELDALVVEVQKTDFKTLKDPAALAKKYADRLKAALWADDHSTKLTLSPDQKKKIDTLIPHLARLTAEVFRRRARNPAQDEPYDVARFGGIFFRLDGRPKNAVPTDGFEHSLRKAVAEAMGPAKPATKEEACSAVCKTLERIDKWGYDGSPVRQTWSGADRINKEGQWAFALWSMEALFVVEAAPLCKSVPKRAEIVKGMLDRWIRSGKLKPGTLTSDGKFGPAGLHYSNLLLGRLKNFAAGDKELAAALPKELASAEKIDALRQSVYGRLATVLKDFPTLYEGVGGSNLELHTLSSFISGMGPDMKPVMEGILERTKTNTGSHPVCKIPYDPIRFRGRSVNPRESAARCVPFYLAKLLATGNTEKNRSELLSALENWGEFFGDHLSEVPRNGAHASETRDQLAPYYYSPTTLPSLAAASMLAASATGSERERALKVLATMNRSVMASYLGDGEWAHPTSQKAGFFGKGAESFATTGPATAMAMVCSGKGDAGAYAGVKGVPEPRDSEPRQSTPELLPMPRREKPLARDNHDGKAPIDDGVRERPSDRQPPETALGKAFAKLAPKSSADVPGFVRRLVQRDGIDGAAKAMGQPESRKRFLSAAGIPEGELADEVADAIAFEHESLSRLRSSPKSPWNRRWLPAFGAASRASAAEAAAAVKTLNGFRDTVESKDERERDRLLLRAVDWAKNVPAAERAAVKEKLRKVTVDKNEKVPPRWIATDAQVRRALLAALELVDKDKRPPGPKEPPFTYNESFPVPVVPVTQ